MNRAGFAFILAFLVMGVADAMGPLSDAVEKQFAVSTVTATMLPFFVFIAFAAFSVAITLGTGFGGGIVRNGELFLGDNSAAGEIWLLRNKAGNDAFVEEGASIRAVQSTHAQVAGIDAANAPTPKEIFEIGMGRALGNEAAARQAFATLGEVVGDVLANALTLIDGLAVIGGGLAGAAPLFMPRLVEEMNGTIAKYNGERLPRLAQRVFDLDDEAQREQFLRGETREITVPRSPRKIAYDPLKRIGVCVSELGANQAIGIGAYAYALQQLDR